MKQQTNKEILLNALPDIKDGIKKIDYIFDKIFDKFYFGEKCTEEEMYTMRLCVELLQTFGFIKGCIEKEKKEMGEITADKVRSAAFKTIEFEMPEMDYGCEYEKDASLAFMYKVEGILSFAKRLAEECTEG